MAVVVLLLMVLFGADQVRSSASDHRYKEGEAVPLYANKVGPFHNPRYFHFHFHFFFFFFFRAGSGLTSLSVLLTFWFSKLFTIMLYLSAAAAAVVVRFRFNGFVNFRAGSSRIEEIRYPLSFR